MPKPIVGGFALKNKFISSEKIRTDLHLAPNAIVMLYGCFTAGSSGIDNPSIDSAEAQRRVAQYSDPFFDIGAAGYYADWYGDAFQMFVRYLFQGKTLKGAYDSFYDFNNATAKQYVNPDHPDLALWLDKDFWYGAWQYNNAFSGLPNATLEDLFNASEIVVSPSDISYMAELTYPPESIKVNITSTTSETFNWTATVTSNSDSWLQVTPMSGISGEQMTITLTPSALANGIYQTNVQVVAESPDIQTTEQTITITLSVVDDVTTVYFPLVTNNK